jgi:hypothetical protein
MSRLRHQNKDIEAVLSEAEDHGWTVIISKKSYWKLLCSCPEKHIKWVALTPSGSNYHKNLASWLKRQSCW